MAPIVTLVLALLAGALRPAPGTDLRTETFRLAAESEVVATLTASCAGCSWAAPGREGAVLLLSVDGRYSQHLILSRGEGPARYDVVLGALERGDHRLTVTLDRAATPAGAQAASVLSIETRARTPGTSEHVALAHSPRLYARPDTIGRFSDLPLLMWYESETTPRGTRLRYSVVFSNEDGGTPADRLMATWGRVTDIEYVYGVELDQGGRILAAEYQGPEHRILPFRGRRDGQHPRLWVVTENNMVSDHGATGERYAPAPVPFTLDEVSREVVMDAYPWTYRVSDEEALREGRIDEAAAPGSGRIPDPRRFLYLEACGDLEGAMLAFDVAVQTGAGTTWVASDGALARARIARSGCFRGAVALPPGAGGARIEALRFRAYTRPAREAEPPGPKGAGTARITRVNRLFRLGPDHVPGPSLFRWEGEAVLAPEGPPFELALPGDAPSSR
jgi:hypothetical protein